MKDDIISWSERKKKEYLEQYNFNEKYININDIRNISKNGFKKHCNKNVDIVVNLRIKESAL